MAYRLFRSLRKASSIVHFSLSKSQSIICSTNSFSLVKLNECNNLWSCRNYSHGLVNLVISEGKPKFETHITEPPKKEKWKTKKRLKMQRKREKWKRQSANKRDPRCLGVKGKKRSTSFRMLKTGSSTRLNRSAKIKEALLIERLKKYEVRRSEGPVVEPEHLSGEERFYMKKMAQKRSNYVPVGRRGVFGGVVLNMHLHWKRHETVKVICKPCKPGQVHQYAEEIARLSGGTPIQIIGNDTIIFYRGKNYVQPNIMSPIDTLSKKKALEKSKYEQSLESVRRFIAIAEKELELYYRHIALYGDPNERSAYTASTSVIKGFTKPQNLGLFTESVNSTSDGSLSELSDVEFYSKEQHTGVDSEDGDLSGTGSDLENASSSSSYVHSDDEESTTELHESSSIDSPSVVR
ncbi:hypothetical protein IFM89_021026 [Coptis chinensis]|uniref:CRM domain-containing protein n=1 Tax=Coptis chinensis TaxID=261450 RepID=A0A835H4E9_9MAGN|nr:hypothetical protein IFM89_021026 [Coptis chinensis]